MYKGTLIRSGGNAKTIKGDKFGEYETAIMYLAPASQSLMGNVCPLAATAGCEKACLFKAGRAGTFTNIVKARIAKTQRYFKDRAAFMVELVTDIERFVRYCERKGVKPAVRLNGTSDIQWELGHPIVHLQRRFASIFDAFPEVQFYDYTKITKRAYRSLPSNYSLTLSYSEARPEYAAAVIKAANETGLNMAVVYRTKTLRDEMVYRCNVHGFERPTYFGGGGFDGEQVLRPIIDGDATDMRFTDPKGVIVGLYAKGPAKRDTTGFVVG